MKLLDTDFDVEAANEAARAFMEKRERAKAQLADRKKAERLATMTPTQHRRAMKARTAQLNVRVTPAVKELAGRLADHLGVGLVDTIEKAIAQLAKQEGIK